MKRTDNRGKVLSPDDARHNKRLYFTDDEILEVWDATIEAGGADPTMTPPQSMSNFIMVLVRQYKKANKANKAPDINLNFPQDESRS